MSTDFAKIKATIEDKINKKFISTDLSDQEIEMIKQIQLYSLDIVIDVLKEYETSQTCHPYYPLRFE
ncbi:hypothetical protein LN736_18510 [Clostridium sp. WLY-B-L2]|uniref:Uncharacterized protein n=1 Tax=Clostridium aromativorans TaxID=2836848 RepID=A0ABS8NCK4_9CLOT|nr:MULTISPECIES: hypothetical protein [Clostridium]KAA8675265.1 hypothetical protein F3O63_05060 [Clostridium sp. HV4-5-A1G]MCC9296825.1 hypothetical protein [Clostridium aromativorans]CAB1262648.1 hypothetical protein CLOSBL3_20554 [Clostridiaceae bacterium BL-3]